MPSLPKKLDLVFATFCRQTFSVFEIRFDSRYETKAPGRRWVRFRRSGYVWCRGAFAIGEKTQPRSQPRQRRSRQGPKGTWNRTTHKSERAAHSNTCMQSLSEVLASLPQEAAALGSAQRPIASGLLALAGHGDKASSLGCVASSRADLTDATAGRSVPGCRLCGQHSANLCTGDPVFRQGAWPGEGGQGLFLSKVSDIRLPDAATFCDGGAGLLPDDRVACKAGRPCRFCRFQAEPVGPPPDAGGSLHSKVNAYPPPSFHLSAAFKDALPLRNSSSTCCSWTCLIVPASSQSCSTRCSGASASPASIWWRAMR